MPVATEKIMKSPADILDYRNTLVRTKNCIPLGRMRTIAIGPCDTYKPPPGDPIINGWGPQPQAHARGRMIDLSGQWLPIAQDPATGMILCTAPLRRADGHVGLPDLVDPAWRADSFTEEEAMNPDCDANCRKTVDVIQGGPGQPPKTRPHVHVNLRGNKDKPRMIPQRLEDRTNDVLLGTNFMAFQPVERITYQPEDISASDHKFKPAEWRIRFLVDGDAKHCCFLVDYNHLTGQGTGECHFFGGIPMLDGDARG